jgi:hypothetical protein
VKRVFGSYNQQLVHHVKNLLEAAGIEVLLRNQFLSSAMGELPPAETQPEIWIFNDADLEKANQILHSSLSAKAGPAWQCAKCGETSEGQFTQCWSCGTARPV